MAFTFSNTNISENQIVFVYEECAYSGVRKIAGKVREDIAKVFGAKPIGIEYTDLHDTAGFFEHPVFFGTVGKSEILDSLAANGQINLFDIAGSNEVYSLSEMNGRLVTNAVNNSEGGYVPVYFTFDNNGQFPSGAYVEVFLLGEDSSSVISLPKDAIVEQQGKYYVYVRHDKDCYEKRLVEIGMDNGKDVEIIRGLNDGEPVVVHGAIIIHLAESSGTIPEGHSHNH